MYIALGRTYSRNRQQAAHLPPASGLGNKLVLAEPSGRAMLINSRQAVWLVNASQGKHMQIKMG